MTSVQKVFARSALIFSALTLIALAANAQSAQVAPRITQAIDEGKLVTLHGNMPPAAIAENDRGALPSEFRMEHMMLQLQRSPEQERELEQYIDGLTKPGSPNFHKWLTAQQFGERYGLAQSDLDTITGWLTAHGLTVNGVYPNGMVIDFSGTAGQVGGAFHTQIHALEVNGVKHIANMSDPRIPAALVPAVVGVFSLHDFRPHWYHKMKTAYTSGSGSTLELSVVPGDLATIYNLNPAFSAGTSGQGQTVIVIEDSDLYSDSDFTTFRSTFGLSSSFPSGSLVTTHPTATGNSCTDPGLAGADAESEAAIDTEYASAAAPSATIDLASCADTETTFGGFIAMENLVNDTSSPPAIMSLSAGLCEAENGSAANAAIYDLYQQAASEGASVFIAAGDEGAASCNASDAGTVKGATYGIGVSGWASTPYNVAVGGTDFGDVYAGTYSEYWSSTNSATYESAESYIPEIPWNDSCASVLISNYATGSSITYGTNGFCNSTTAASDGLLDIAAGSGGPSGCATGTPAITGVVGGTCAGYSKPSWQSIVGNPADSVRDLPDVSLFAGNGLWAHYYIFCFSDTAGGGSACTGAPSTWSAAGGTSFASPIWAGFQALINQKAGGAQGLPNPTYYSLASNEYGASGSSSCNSSNGNTVGSSCIFYDVTLGDMDVDCTGTYSCYLPSGTYGVLSTSDSAYDPAYSTQTGWDFATGIGTVNVANLVDSWQITPGFSLSASPSSVTITQGGQGGTSTITVSPTGGFTGSVTLSASGLPSGVTASFGTNPTTSKSVLTLTASATAATGTTSVTITGVSGNLTQTTSVSLTVSAAVAASFGVSAAPAVPATISPGSTATSTITVTGAGGFSGSVTLSCSVTPSKSGDTDIPTCAVTGTNPVSLSSSTTSATSTVTVSTTAPSAAPPAAIRNRPMGGGWLALAGAIMLAWLIYLGAPKGRRWSTVAAGVLLVALAGLAACGGGSSTPVSTGGTSADTYTISVSAVSGSTTHTSSLTVTVN